MTRDEVDGFRDGRIRILKTMEPFLEVYPAVHHQVDVFLADPALLHQMKHFVSVHSLDSAARVADHHHLVDTKLIDRHKD